MTNTNGLSVFKNFLFLDLRIAISDHVLHAVLFGIAFMDVAGRNCACFTVDKEGQIMVILCKLLMVILGSRTQAVCVCCQLNE